MILSFYVVPYGICYIYLDAWCIISCWGISVYVCWWCKIPCICCIFNTVVVDAFYKKNIFAYTASCTSDTISCTKRTENKKITRKFMYYRYLPSLRYLVPGSYRVLVQNILPGTDSCTSIHVYLVRCRPAEVQPRSDVRVSCAAGPEFSVRLNIAHAHICSWMLLLLIYRYIKRPSLFTGLPYPAVRAPVKLHY